MVEDSLSQKPKILITGGQSGLGRFLAEKLDVISMSRENADSLLAPGQAYDVVIHTAHSRSKDVKDKDLSAYISDTVDLTRRALSACKGYFVYVSSISVYPEDHSLREDDPILLDDVRGLYGISKLMCESLVRASSLPCAILRLSSMIGTFSPPNVTTRLLQQQSGFIPLCKKSLFNYITHDEVYVFIKEILRSRVSGVWNIGADRLIEIGDVARHFGLDVEYGHIVYQAPLVPTDKASLIVKKQSADILEKLEAVYSQLNMQKRLLND